MRDLGKSEAQLQGDRCQGHQKEPWPGNEHAWDGDPGLHDPGESLPISGPQFPHAPQEIWTSQRGSKIPKPSQPSWPDELSGFASQRAAAMGQAPDPDHHGAFRTAPGRAGALTARRDAKPTSLHRGAFFTVAIFTQLPRRQPSGAPRDHRQPGGRGLWSAVMTPYAGSVPSLSTFLFLLGSASLAVIYARPLCARRSEALGL